MANIPEDAQFVRAVTWTERKPNGNRTLGKDDIDDVPSDDTADVSEFDRAIR